MEVYSQSSDNLYESRSDFTSTIVNKRRNYENLQRSIQAHKNRLAMARMKKGKNLPSDDLSKYEGSGCCRQSTVDTNEGFEQYRFRRHTQSSLNKVNKPVNKYNNLSVTNSFDQKYDNEQLYIRKYDEFKSKVDQSLVKCNTKLEPKLSNESDFSFDQNFGVNKLEVPIDELEKKIVEVLGRLLLKKELRPNLNVLSQQEQVPLDPPKVFQDESHDRVVDLLTKCISTTLNTAANDSLDGLNSARTSKSVNVEINLNMPSSKESEPLVTVNMQDVVEESSVFIENVFDKNTKVVRDDFFKDFFGKFKKLYSSEKKVKRVGGVQPTWVGDQQQFKTRVQSLVQRQGVDNFKDKRVDLEEQKLWDMTLQSQMVRKNSLVGCGFRPFSRSRSQSVRERRKVGSVRPQVLSKNDSFFQNPGVGIVRKNSGVVPVNKDGFKVGLDLIQRQVEHMKQKQPQHVVQQVDDFRGGHVPSLGVDLTFNPFNLPQPYFNPHGQQQLFDKQGVVSQDQDFVRVPVVQRNGRFDTFSKRSGSRSVVGRFEDNVTQRFERNGFGCLEMPGRSRQGTRPVLQRTFNMNKKALLEPRMLTGQFPRVEQGKVFEPSNGSMGFNVMKRINTEPRNFNGLQVQSPSFMSQKQLTGDVKMKVNQPITKAKLLKTRSVIDTLNQLSKINDMY